MTKDTSSNGSTYSQTSGGTISLEQYLTSKIDAQDQKNEQRLTAIEGRATESAGLVKDALTTAATATEKATEKAEGVTTGKIEGVQSEMRIRLSALEAKVDANASHQQKSIGRDSGIGSAWAVISIAIGFIIGAGGIVVAIVTLVKGH